MKYQGEHKKEKRGEGNRWRFPAAVEASPCGSSLHGAHHFSIPELNLPQSKPKTCPGGHHKAIFVNQVV